MAQPRLVAMLGTSGALTRQTARTLTAALGLIGVWAFRIAGKTFMTLTASLAFAADPWRPAVLRLFARMRGFVQLRGKSASAPTLGGVVGAIRLRVEMSDPVAPLALSHNFMTFVFLDENGGYINNGTVTLTLTDPTGVVQLNAVAVPFVGPNGLYRYQTSPANNPIAGVYQATWHGVDTRGLVFQHTEPIQFVQ